MYQVYCIIILNITIKNVIKSIIAHHIVGVQVLFLCSFANSVAFQTVASSLICFQSLLFIKNLINEGINNIQIIKVAIQKEKICIKYEFINFLLKYTYLRIKKTLKFTSLLYKKAIRNKL